MIESKIREYEGIATESLICGDNKKTLEVYVPEFTPTKVGSFPENAKKITTVVRNEQGVDVPLVIDSRSTISCTYLGVLSNQDIPNVHIGEKVKIFNYDNTTDFFWYLHDVDQNLRTVEHAKWKIANKPNQKDPLNVDNSYTIEMDTRPGQRGIKIKTSKGTGESFQYDIIIDTDKATIDIKDDRGNGVFMESGFAKNDYLTSQELKDNATKSAQIVDTISKSRKEKGEQTLSPSKPIPRRPPVFRYYNNWNSVLEIIADVANLNTENEINLNAKNKIELNTNAYVLNASKTITTNTDIRENYAAVRSSLVAPLIGNTGNFTSTSNLSGSNVGMEIVGNVRIIGTVLFDASTRFEGQAVFVGGVIGDNV